MKARIDYTNVPEALRGMYQLEHFIHNSGVEESLVHLVKMCASQINGCAYCLDLHSKDARAAARPSRDSTCSTRGLRAGFKTCGIAAIPAILSVMQPDFSATQTVWRRERNSNPRYGFKMALAAESGVSIAFALLTRRLIRFRGALSERAVASFKQLEEFGFGAADLIFYVPGLHGLGEGDHHFRQKVQGLQMATGCLVYQLCQARFNLGHPLRTIVSLGQNFLFRNLPQQFWDSLGFSGSPTGVARTPFLELKCFGWFFVTPLIFNIMGHASPRLIEALAGCRAHYLFAGVFFPSPHCGIDV
jgi:AhpD family alkylhydroperoxidase